MNKTIRRSILLLLTGFTALFYNSCRKSSSSPSWDVDILAPLIKSSLTINNLIPDSLLQDNPDSSIKIVYNSDLINFSSDTLAKVPDTTLTLSFKDLTDFNYYGGHYLITPTTSTINFKLGDVQLKKATIKTEFIRLYLENRVDSMVVFEYKIPSATLGGVPFDVVDSIPGKSGNTPTIYDKTFSLAGYTVDLTGPSGTGSNIVTTFVKAYVSKRVSYVTIKPTDSLYIINSAYSIKPAYAKGYLGQSTTMVGPQQTDFSLFSGIKSGILNLPNVNIDVVLENSIGADARIKISNISAINSSSGINIPLVCSSVINKSININRALETGIASSPVIPSTQTLHINSSNSNISSLLNIYPDKLGYSMQVNVNPLGNVSGDNDFVYSGYGIKAKLNVSIPLSVVASNLTLSDTLLLDLSSIKQEDNVNGGFLYLYTTNGLPLDAGIQIYLLDSKLHITDSLLTPPSNIIASALVDASFKVTEAVNTKLTIPVTKAKIAELVKTKKALVVARFNTTKQPNPVSIYSNYKLDFKLIADLNYRISGNTQ